MQLSVGEHVRPLLIVVALLCLQGFAGPCTLIFFSQNIFHAAGFDHLDHGLSAFLLGVAMVGGCIGAVWALDFFGRKYLLLCSRM